jgi:hypothetical protein
MGEGTLTSIDGRCRERKRVLREFTKEHLTSAHSGEVA